MDLSTHIYQCQAQTAGCTFSGQKSMQALIQDFVTQKKKKNFSVKSQTENLGLAKLQDKF